MINEALLKDYNIGKDGFSWWLGQVCEAETWADNYPCLPVDSQDDLPGFKRRVKVRVLGWNTTSRKLLKNDELPWAYCLLPVTAGGGGGGSSESLNLTGGEWVFGFYLDGDNGQQPVVIGVLDKSTQEDFTTSIPQDDGFKPFSGYTTEDEVPRGALPTTQEEAKGVAEDVDVSKTNNKEVIETGVGQVGRDDGATNEQYLNEKKSSTIASNSDCDKAPTGSIQREIKNMIAEVQRIQKTATDWETKVSTKVDNIEKEIAKVKDNATKAITGDVKRITAELQKNALKEVNDALSDTYYEVFPTELPLVKQKAEEANSELACAFKNIMKNLTGMVGNFLNQIMDRFITAPMCAVENFVGSLLGKVSGLIDSAVKSVMGPIKALLAGMGLATSSLDDVMGFATDALSFLSCDQDPKCSNVKEWNPVNGPEITATLNLDSIFSKAKEAAELVKGGVEGLGNIGDAISDVAKNADFSDVFEDSCNVGPIFCGPPRVEFIGGGGSGATGNVIVSALTTVLGVDIITPGGGYIGPPSVKFWDSCDNGRGATGTAVVENGQVVKVIMEDTGIDYLPTPDGSQGGDGRTWADRDETTVKRSDGTYDTPYKPGNVVNVCPGDEWTPAGGSPIIVTEEQGCTDITTPFPPDKPTRGTSPTLGTGEYPVILEIDEINISNPGFGYDCSKDKVIIEPSNGAELSLRCDPLGSIIGVDVINGGIGFTSDPDIYIQSDTGYNAILMPVFKVNRVGEDIDPEAVVPTALVQVVDCVGKF